MGKKGQFTAENAAEMGKKRRNTAWYQYPRAQNNAPGFGRQISTGRYIT